MQRRLRRWGLLGALATFVVLASPTTMLGVVKIIGPSMISTLQLRDTAAVNMAAYGLKVPFTHNEIVHWADPRRGEVVQLKHVGLLLLKRVIGVPGDRVEMTENRLSINGRPSSYRPGYETVDGVEHLIRFIPGPSEFRTFAPITVPAQEFFVMGDNRDISRDSRVPDFGLVDRSEIRGRLIGVIWRP